MESDNLGTDRTAEAKLPLLVRAAAQPTSRRPGARRMIRWGAAALIVLVLGGLLWSRLPAPPPPVASAPLPAPIDGIAALGRLEPLGGVIAITPPAPSRDANVRQLRVSEGATVAAGEILAVMETFPGVEAALGEATAQVSLREADLARALRMVEAEKARAEAQRTLALAKLAGAEQALARASQLTGSTVTPARIEELETDREVLAAELAQVEAQLAQYAGEVARHPDVVSAAAALQAARAALRRAQTDLENTLVRAPTAGRILSVAVRVGEPSPSDGMMRLAAHGPSQAVLEVHQDRIHLVQTGAPVTLRAAAVAGELTGKVERIGVEVQRQAVFESDPAANTDARVFEVRVTLDDASSRQARDLINLQVLATITTGAAP